MLSAGEMRITRLIQAAIHDVNETRGAHRAIPATPDTVLVGEGGVLDSLGFVTLAVTLETEIEETFSVDISIMEIVVAGATDDWSVASLAAAIHREVCGAGIEH